VSPEYVITTELLPCGSEAAELPKKYVAVEVSLEAAAVRAMPPGVRSTPPDCVA
jgi:hypothetical protein